MTLSTIWFLIAVLIFAGSNVRGRVYDYCYANDPNPYLYFGAKTAYDVVRGSNFTHPNIPKCEPVQIWMLARHATRYCSRGTSTKFLILPELRDRIVNNHEKLGRGRLCRKDLENLKAWSIYRYLHLIGNHKVTTQGFNDTVSFAKRLLSEFPSLITSTEQDITPENYKFRTSSTDRTNDTMYAFIEGLFDNKFPVEPKDVYVDNILLRIEKHCPTWQAHISKAEFKREENLFVDGPEMYNLIQAINRRLGFTNNDVTFETVLSIYTACRYDIAWHPSELSAWCAVFTKEDLRVLEYRDDLDYYYYCGKGQPLNKQVGCSTLQDMFKHFRRLEEGNIANEPKGLFYFTHSVGIHMLISFLGIKNDRVPITALNYQSQKERLFRTSLFGAFSTNIIAVFYKCSDDLKSPNKVMLYLSEKPMQMDGCENGLCDWEFLKKKFEPIASNCNLDICWKRNEGNSGFLNHAYSFNAIIVFSIALFYVV